jgi:hypothetical protein
MLGSATLDVIFGLVFIFYALALICSGAVEWIATRMKKRSKYLIRGIRDLVEDGTTSAMARRDWMKPAFWFNQAQQEQSTYQATLRAGNVPDASAQPAGPETTLEAIMGHPLIAAFKQTTPDGTVTKNPSYLPGFTFAQVMIDLLTPDQTAENEQSFAEVVDDVLPGTSSDLRKALLSLYKLSDFDVGRLTTSIEVWFDAQMDRITGGYKRWAKRWIIAVAAVVVIVGGIDSIAIGRTLYVDETVRAAVVQAAEGDALCPAGTAADACAEKAKSVVSAAGVPWGFRGVLDAFDAGWQEAGLKILGLAISILAASLGAPFWYKVLDRFGGLRNSGTRDDQEARQTADVAPQRGAFASCGDTRR